MAVKYKIEYKDLENNDFTLELDNDNYVGSEISIDGYCSLNTSSVTEVYEPIRGRSLSFTAKATISQPLSDLWQDDEYYWRVVYKKNNNILFVGYVSSEGVFEDYNSDVWELNIEAVGILAVLNDLAFVQLDGNPYTDFADSATTLARALKRGYSNTSHELPIRMHSELTGEGQSTGSANNFNSYGLIDQNIFLSSDKETYQDCYSVVSELMISLGCVIFQEGGIWYVIPINKLGESSLIFNEYDSSGVYQSDITINDLETVIGIQGVSNLFHCSKNQQKSLKRSVDTFVLRHSNEYVEELVDNPNLVVSGSLIDGWVIEDSNNVTLSDPISINADGLAGLSLSSNLIPLKKFESFELALDVNFVGSPADFWFFRIQLLGGSIDYALRENTWINTNQVNGFEFEYPEEGDYLIQIPIPTLPEDGSFKISLHQLSYGFTTPPVGAKVFVREASLKPTTGIVAGTEIKFSKTLPKKERAKEPEEIRLNTSTNKSIVNQFYKPDLTPMEFVNSPLNVNDVSLCNYVAHSRAKVIQNKSVVFSGNVYGEVPFLGVKNYTGIASKMIPIEHIYDSKSNTTSLKCLESNTSQALEGVITENIVFTNTIKPTIIG